MRRVIVGLTLTLSLGAVVAIGARTQDRSPLPQDLPPAADVTPGAMCIAPDPEGRIRTLAIADGAALRFRQEPAWLLARDDHGVALRPFVVAGDVDEVQFDRWDADANDFVAEIWTRTASDTVAGRLVSMFEPSWNASVVQAALSRARVGFDQPALYWGRYRGPVGRLLADGPAVSLRVGSSVARAIDVVPIDDRAQYASHVVNLVVPDFGDSELTSAVNLAAVTRRFYQLFEDSYDVIAVVPFEPLLDASASAYHLRVRNQVSGVGLPALDRSLEFGSGGALLGVELYHQTSFLSSATSNHELAHTWGHNFDWTRIAGITRAGHSPVGHGPLMTGGESLVGAVLRHSRRPFLRDDGEAVIERTPAPARHHPLDLYAMGLLEPSALPGFTVFEDQGQFDATAAATPAPGTVISGGRKQVSINDVMAAHGRRDGPVISELRRATIVVSRERLLTAAELAPWNAAAARHEDGANTGTPGFDGAASFAQSTSGRIRLTTAVRPLDRAAAASRTDSEPSAFGPFDCRGFEFTTAPPTRVRAGQRFTIAGRVTARDRTDFSVAMFRFLPSDDVSDKVERASTDVSRGGEFRADVEIRSGREGQYTVEGFLFWPEAPPQYSRCRLSVLNVTP